MGVFGNSYCFKVLKSTELEEVAMDVAGDGVAVLTIKNPPVNALTLPLLRDLKDKYEEAQRRFDIKAIVIVGEAGRFSGGFDINTLREMQKQGSMSFLAGVPLELMDVIENGRKPSVAAIEGLALGGGLELAMCCHARIATSNAQLGLPELQLGIIPGLGGTQRLPRHVGLGKAIEMLLTSKPITSEEGRELGLIDQIVSHEQLLGAARQWALDIVENRKPWVISLHKTDRLQPLDKTRGIIQLARIQAKKTTPHLKHPLLCLDVIEEGVISGGLAGIVREEAASREVLTYETSKALTHMFLAERSTSKGVGVINSLKPRTIKTVGVVGGGFMGSSIVTALILSNINVILKEVDGQFLQKGLDRVKAILQNRVKKGKLTKKTFEKALSLVRGTLNYDEFKDMDMIIETVVENVPLKQEIFSELERVCKADCILASNTSSIDLNIVGAKTRSQDRIIGAHFFSPAHVMRLLEIIRTQKTSSQVILDVMSLAKRLKKTPVVVGNCVGFLVNRVFFPYPQAATMLVDLGVDPYRIDHVILEFGMPMGPFRLVDFGGLGVAIATSSQYQNCYSDRVYITNLFHLLCKANRLGEKTGKGFYVYDDKGKAQFDPELKKFLEESRCSAKLMPRGEALSITDEEIVEMMFFPVVNEACRALEEGIALKASDIDVASVLGMAFPTYRGGILFWADSVGATYILSRLKKWHEDYGTFFKPSRYLEERVSQGINLAAPISPNQSRL